MDDDILKSIADKDGPDALPEIDRLEKERGFPFIFDNSLTGIVIVGADSTIRIAKPPFCKLIGYDNHGRRRC